MCIANLLVMYYDTSESRNLQPSLPRP